MSAFCSNPTDGSCVYTRRSWTAGGDVAATGPLRFWLEKGKKILKNRNSCVVLCFYSNLSLLSALIHPRFPFNYLRSSSLSYLRSITLVASRVWVFIFDIFDYFVGIVCFISYVRIIFLFSPSLDWFLYRRWVQRKIPYGFPPTTSCSARLQRDPQSLL